MRAERAPLDGCWMAWLMAWLIDQFDSYSPSIHRCCSDFIERHNNAAQALSSSYTMAHNHYSHLTFDEFKARVSK